MFCVSAETSDLHPHSFLPTCAVLPHSRSFNNKPPESVSRGSVEDTSGDQGTQNCDMSLGHFVGLGLDFLTCVLSHSVVSNSATPWTVTCQAPLSLEFSRQKYWSGLPCLPPGDLPHPGIEPRTPALHADSLLSEPLGKPISK